MELCSQLQNHHKGSLFASDYILKVKTVLADDLAASRDPVFDRDLMIFIVGGLGYNSIYNAFGTCINM